MSVGMIEDFPFVKVPPGAEKVLGRKDPKTRVYRRDGEEEEIAGWYDKLTGLFGDMVSPGGVTMFARISRAAVYLAINEGRLTAFGFHVVTESRAVFGFKRRRRETPYVFIPVSECKAWGEIVARKVKTGTVTNEEAPGRLKDADMRKLEGKIMKGRDPQRKGAKK